MSSKRFASSIEAVERQRLADDNLEHETPLSEVFEDQVNCADIVLLTKTDLVNKKELQIVKNYISNLSARNISIVENLNGNIDPSLILDLELESEKDLLTRKSHHDNHNHEHDHNDFESFVLELDEILSHQGFLKKMKQFLSYNKILRVKGFVYVKNKPMRLLIQAVGSRLRSQFDRMWGVKEVKSSKLVFIMQTKTIDHLYIKEFFKN